MKKDSVKTKYEKLVAEVKTFVNTVRGRKFMTAFFYKASEAPAQIVAGAPPQQFNVLEVRALITHVLTAHKLGYETILTANENELFLNFVEKYPLIPMSLGYPS